MKPVYIVISIFVLWVVLVVGVLKCRGGDTFDCINTRGNYINYLPPAPGAQNTSFTFAPARYEWQPMLDADDLRTLIFLRAWEQRYVIVYGRGE